MNADTYRNETLDLFRRLESAGFQLLSVDNGEEETKREDVDLATFLSETMACDEAWLRVRNAEGKGRTLYLVYGNGKGELVCDYTCSDDLERVVDAFYQANS
jgi:hypothetical protein